MVPYHTPCPQCGSRIKISRPEFIGKTANCPGCRQPFEIPGPPSDLDDIQIAPLEEEDRKPAPVPKASPSRPVAAKPAPEVRKPVTRPSATPSASRPASASSNRSPASNPAPAAAPQKKVKKPADDFDDLQFDDYGDLPLEEEVKPARSVSSKKPIARKKKKSSKSSLDLSWLKSGGSVLLVCLIVLSVGFKIARRTGLLDHLGSMFGSGTAIAQDWMPESPALVGEIAVADLLKTPELQAYLNSPAGIALQGQMAQSGVGFTLQDIESLRFAVDSRSSPGPELNSIAIMIDFASHFDVNDFLAKSKNSRVTFLRTIQDKSVHAIARNSEFILFPTDTDKLLIGHEHTIGPILAREGSASSTSPLAILDERRQINVVGLLPKAPLQKQGSKTIMEPGSVALSLNYGSSLTGTLIAGFESSIPSSEQERLKTEFKTEISKLASMIGGDNPIAQALTQGSISFSGRRVNLAISMPAQSVTSSFFSSMFDGRYGYIPSANTLPGIIRPWGAGTPNFLPDVLPPQFQPSARPDFNAMPVGGADSGVPGTPPLNTNNATPSPFAGASTPPANPFQPKAGAGESPAMMPPPTNPAGASPFNGGFGTPTTPGMTPPGSADVGGGGMNTPSPFRPKAGTPDSSGAPVNPFRSKQ